MNRVEKPLAVGQADGCQTGSGGCGARFEGLGLWALAFGIRLGLLHAAQTLAQINQICEQAIGVRNREVILETVSLYWGSPFSLSQTGCLLNAAQCCLWTSWFSAESM